MRRLIICVIFAYGLTGAASIAKAQLSNPPPTRALVGYAGYELAPITLDPVEAGQKGKKEAAAKVQGQFDALVAPLIGEWNRKPGAEGAPHLLLQPRIDTIKKVSGGARFWGGAFAGDSYVTMHVRLVEQPGEVVIGEPMFYQHAAAMSGAWTVGGQDTDMLRRVAQLVADYLKANYDAPVGGPTGQPK